MKLEIHLTTDERIAMRRLANDIGCNLEDAVKTGLRAWLISQGYLDSETADNDNEDTETQGEA